MNSDAATAYVNNYTATLAADGSWVVANDDNPATTNVEGWRNITQLVNPRFTRFTMTLNF